MLNFVVTMLFSSGSTLALIHTVELRIFPSQRKVTVESTELKLILYQGMF